MDSSAERATRRMMDDINQVELEEMAGGAAPRQSSDHQLHLNMLRRRIQQQRSMVAKLSRDDLENQYLHRLEELEILKKEENTKDIYVKKLSTKILRLQRSESIRREDQRGFSASLRTELEQKIRSLENQLRMAKVYGSSLPRRGSKIVTEPGLNKSQTDSLRQQIQTLEADRRDEEEAHRRTVRELQAEIEKSNGDNARTNLLENMEITRLTRQLAKTSQDLLSMKNDYIDMRPKYEELQINKIVITRENERFRQEIDRHLQTIDSIELQLREAREKSLQQIHDQERANRLESELEWFKRQHQTHRSETMLDPSGRAAENLLRQQVKTLEEELQRETNGGQELRKRVTEREMDIEKALRDVSELRAVNLHLKQECEELRSKYEAAIRTEPKKSDGWFQAPSGMRNQEIDEALRLHDAFRHRRNMSTSTEDASRNEPASYRADPQLLEELERLRLERQKIQQDLFSARDNLKRAEEVIIQLHQNEDQLNNQLRQTQNQLQNKNGTTSLVAAEEMKELKRVIEEKTRQLSQQIRLVEDLERQLSDVADGATVYNLEEEVADQSRLSAENVLLQHGDNLLQLHFGPFSFNEAFFVQAQALRIKKWRLKWSVFGENMFAQDSEQKRPDFDFTAIHCITMDEEIMKDLAEGTIRLEIVGIRNDFSRAFAYASFNCRKLLEDSYQRLNRVRGEVPLISQFNIGQELGVLAYWIRMKFDIEETQAMFQARRKALDYVEDNKEKKNHGPTADQIWMKEKGKKGNVLHVGVHGCRAVGALVGPGPPSPCVLYQFYNSKTTYTPTITGTENPNFQHLTSFRILMDENLHVFLLSEKLDVYVTDSNDHDKGHFLGCCQISLAALTRGSMQEFSLPLFTQDNRQNGSITLSLSWERPYQSETENSRSIPHRQPTSSRINITPRGSLVSVKHAAKLLKVDQNGSNTQPDPSQNTQPKRKTNYIENGNVEKEDLKLQPPSRKIIPRPSRGNSNERTNGYGEESEDLHTADAPSLMENYQKANGHRRLIELSPRNSEVHSHGDWVTEEGRRTLSPDSARKSEQAGSPQQRRVSENGPSFLRRLRSSDTLEKMRRATVADPMSAASTTNRQTVQAELHPTGSLQEKRSTFKTSLSGSTRKASLNSAEPSLTEVERNATGKMEGAIAERRDSPLTPQSLASHMIRVVVHSLYFVEGAAILGDLRSGEIFVIFELLGMEHESPLAVVKPNLPNTVLTFEFEKVFSVERHSDQREFLSQMMQKTPPGRIPFSVYFQPDDESMESELVGVAALSLNRLVTKNQDALGAELKLVSPVKQGVTVGYLKITVQAMHVLIDIQNETSS